MKIISIMRSAEVEPIDTRYTPEDLEDAYEEWPSFSRIRIIRRGRPWPSVCKERKIREDKISKLKSMLESSEEQYELIRQQHRDAKRNRDQEATDIALSAFQNHLEMRATIQRRIDRLDDELNPIIVFGKEKE